MCIQAQIMKNSEMFQYSIITRIIFFIFIIQFYGSLFVVYKLYLSSRIVWFQNLDQYFTIIRLTYIWLLYLYRTNYYYFYAKNKQVYVCLYEQIYFQVYYCV